MATVIRFARHGKKKKPYYRIVVQDKRSPRDGKFIEHLGAYEPSKGDASIVVSRERLGYWLGTGAQMSLTVSHRLKNLVKELQVGAPAKKVEAQPKKASRKEA